VNNMMYRKKDGKIIGVLNDYDLAIFKVNSISSSRACTGTRPFMAIDLLGKPADLHRYRHDLESMFYVICDVAISQWPRNRRSPITRLGGTQRRGAEGSKEGVSQ